MPLIAVFAVFAPVLTAVVILFLMAPARTSKLKRGKP